MPRLLSFAFDRTPTTEVYTLSLHDALPISPAERAFVQHALVGGPHGDDPRHLLRLHGLTEHRIDGRSEEHTSELQSRFDLVCRLLLEKKKIGRMASLDVVLELLLDRMPSVA